MYKYTVRESRNGCEVYVNLVSSSAGLHINRQPYLLNLIKEILEPLRLTDSEVLIERDMGRVIGNTDIVKTDDKDSVFYAQPHKTNVFARYVKNRSLTPSSKLTVILHRDKDGNYEISDTWVGPCSPPFPGDARETALSKVYWETHALIMDVKAIRSKTITKVCPY